MRVICVDLPIGLRRLIVDVSPTDAWLDLNQSDIPTLQFAYKPRDLAAVRAMGNALTNLRQQPLVHLQKSDRASLEVILQIPSPEPNLVQEFCPDESIQRVAEICSHDRLELILFAGGKFDYKSAGNFFLAFLRSRLLRVRFISNCPRAVTEKWEEFAGDIILQPTPEIFSEPIRSPAASLPS